jgi:hypothetical protein
MRDDNPKDPTNFVIKGKAREGVDYKLLPKKCWEILKSRFDGMEIIRYKDSDLYNRKFNVKFPAVIQLGC